MTQAFFNKANAEIVKTNKYLFWLSQWPNLTNACTEMKMVAKKKNAHDFRFLTKIFSSLLWKIDIQQISSNVNVFIIGFIQRNAFKI